MRAGTDRPQAGGDRRGFFRPRRPVGLSRILPPGPGAGESGGPR